jgi:CDP-diacylglycerol--serine O-phosphatidyltransferase
MSEDQRGARRARRRERRRRRRENGDHSGLAALLPNLFTTFNLAAGFYSIVQSGEGNYERAAVALIFAAVFDILDGRLARLANTTSRFGFEYDSIADTVSFGVAPAILAFNAGHFHELGWTGWVMGFMFAAGAALRLARFNVTPQRYPGRFEGLPSPAAAGMVLSTVLFVGFLRESGLHVSVPASLPAFGLAALGLLMVSPIPYHSGKNLRLSGYRALVATVFALGLVLAKPDVTLFLIGVAYVSSGPAGWLMRKRSGRALEEFPKDVPDEAAESSSPSAPAS